MEKNLKKNIHIFPVLLVANINNWCFSSHVLPLYLYNTYDFCMYTCYAFRVTGIVENGKIFFNGRVQPLGIPC